MTDWETYQTAYQAADQATKDILHSSLIPECVATNVSKYELDPSHQKILVTLLSEKTLGLIDEPQLVEKTRQAGVPAAQMICTDIQQCLQTQTPSIADTSLEATAEKPETQTVPVNQAKPAAPTSSEPAAAVDTAVKTPEETETSSLASEIAATEAALKSIPKVRTMAQDAQESTDHSSSQEELLNKSNRWTPKE